MCASLIHLRVPLPLLTVPFRNFSSPSYLHLHDWQSVNSNTANQIINTSNSPQFRSLRHHDYRAEIAGLITVIFSDNRFVTSTSAIANTVANFIIVFTRRPALSLLSLLLSFSFLNCILLLVILFYILFSSSLIFFFLFFSTFNFSSISYFSLPFSVSLLSTFPNYCLVFPSLSMIISLIINIIAIINFSTVEPCLIIKVHTAFMYPAFLVARKSSSLV